MPNRFGAHGADERRARYNELRDEGMNPWEAATELGLDPRLTADRYERWRLAGLAKDEPSPGHRSGLAGDEGAVRWPSCTLRARPPPGAWSERRSNVIHRPVSSSHRESAQVSGHV